VSSLRVTCVVFAAVALTTSTAHPQFRMAWRQSPNITVIAATGDHRLALVDEAVAFWNKTLEGLGSGFRLGPVTHVVQPIPSDWKPRSAIGGTHAAA